MISKKMLEIAIKTTKTTKTTKITQTTALQRQNQQQPH